jgi:hypothetical protein
MMAARNSNGLICWPSVVASRGSCLYLLMCFMAFEAQNHQIRSSNSPLDVEVRRPSPNARVAGVQEDHVRCYSREDEANIAAPDGAIFRFLKIGSYHLQIMLHAFGYPDATSLPPALDRFIGGSNCVVEGHCQAERQERAPGGDETCRQ